MSILLFLLPLLFYASTIAAVVVFLFGISILRVGSKSPYYRLKQKQLISGWKWIGIATLIGLTSFLLWSKSPTGLPLMVGKSDPTSTAITVPTLHPSVTPSNTVMPATLTIQPELAATTPEKSPTAVSTKAPTFTPKPTLTPTIANTKAPTFTPSVTNTKAPTFTPTIKPTFAPTWTQKVVQPTTVNTLAPTRTPTPSN